MELLKNIFFIQVIGNGLMESMRGDWRTVALGTIHDDADIVLMQEFWICSSLSQLVFEILNSNASLAYVIEGRMY